LFIKPLGISRLEFVDREHLGAFIEYLQDDNLMSSSINGYLRSLYAVFGFLAEKNVISSDIMKNKFRLKMPDVLLKAIDPEDIDFSERKIEIPKAQKTYDTMDAHKALIIKARQAVNTNLISDISICIEKILVDARQIHILF
jgi:site-specific recombinase XerD